MNVSDNVNHTFHYQHFYTGAFMSEGYPAMKRGKQWIISYYMAFGGLPSNTYSTMSLHSSTSLLAGKTVRMYKFVRGHHSPRILGFSTELHTPISIFSEEVDVVEAYYALVFADNGTSTVLPDLLVSFKGKSTV